MLLNKGLAVLEEVEETLNHLVEVGRKQLRVLDALAEVDERRGSVGVNSRDRVVERIEKDCDNRLGELLLDLKLGRREIAKGLQAEAQEE